MIIQDVNSTVNKALNQKLGLEYWRSAVKFVLNDIWDIPKKNSRLEKIEFFDIDFKESGSVITINCHIYYQDVYAYVNQLWLIEKHKQFCYNYYEKVLWYGILQNCQPTKGRYSK